MKGAAKREWILRSPDPAAVRELSTRNGLAPAASKVLVNRGIVEPRDVERFLSGTLSDLPDPSLLKDVDKAARRLAEAGSRGWATIGKPNSDGSPAVISSHVTPPSADR